MEIENTEVVTESTNDLVEDTGIVSHSLESDMEDLGIGVDEESIEQVQTQKEVVVEEEPKKLSRKERRVQRLANTNKELREKVAELESKQSEQPAKEEAGEINIDDYESYDDYIVALEEAEKKPAESKPTTNEPEIDYEQQEAQIELLEDGNEDYEDFEELVTAQDLALTENVLGYVLEADNSSDVAYYLATHKDETADIAQMSPVKMAKAIAKIELKLDGKPVKKSVRTSKAPKPITPVSGGSAKSRSLNDSDLSFEEHEALLNSRATKNAGGFL